MRLLHLSLEVHPMFIIFHSPFSTIEIKHLSCFKVNSHIKVHLLKSILWSLAGVRKIIKFHISQFN